ncbi:unnamed protein product [Prorocentrum cordatum]|uniref:Uncharacterized protein n=1 Tax=Prorocentrum cordatum TaxID=2364126 RepID=A0ABN9PVB1_9DINO|nr:unnamed protein product [Polarella glacialis]
MPVTIKDGFSVIATDEDVSIAKSWVVKKTFSDNRSRVLCDRLNAGFRAFCLNGFDMLDMMHAKRSEVCDPLLAAAAAPQLDEEAEIGPPAAKVAKKDALDQIPGFVSITVTDESGGTHTMNVKSAAYRRTHLQIEMLPSNLEVLQMKPLVVASGDWAPVIDNPLVSWLAYRHALSVSYCCANKGKVLHKSMKVPTKGDAQCKQAGAEKIAAVLLEWRAQHHTEPSIKA